MLGMERALGNQNDGETTGERQSWKVLRWQTEMLNGRKATRKA